jgi:hypothetical protein
MRENEKTEIESKQQSLRGALKLKPAAHYLSVSPITMRRLVDRGLLKPNRATRHLIFSLSELNRFLSQ